MPHCRPTEQELRIEEFEKRVREGEEQRKREAAMDAIRLAEENARKAIVQAKLEKEYAVIVAMNETIMANQKNELKSGMNFALMSMAGVRCASIALKCPAMLQRVNMTGGRGRKVPPLMY